MAHPDTIMLIRHGEKPVGRGSAVDQHGNTNSAGLIPKGWARAGALAVLFDPNRVTLDSTLPTPDRLVSPRYAKPVHRTWLTLWPVSKRLGLEVTRTRDVNDAKGAARDLLAMSARTVLVCWEHENLVDIVTAFGELVTVTNRNDLPTEWPDDRFDVIWRFDSTGDAWTFGSLNQELLHGDIFRG
jgi:hypothetical protein